MTNKDIIFAYTILDEFGLYRVQGTDYIAEEDTETVLLYFRKPLVLKTEENAKYDYGEAEFNPRRNIKLMNMLISRYSTYLEHNEGIYIKSYYPEYSKEVNGLKRYTMIFNTEYSENNTVTTNYHFKDSICLAEMISLLNGNYRDFSQFDDIPEEEESAE